MLNYPYKTREVRDLAWACFSPALLHSEKLTGDGQSIANCGLGLTAQRRIWLEQLDKRPAALHDHLSKLHNNRLGLYFESLWHFFLRHDAEVNLIAHNLPIREDGRTIGEFDCLYYCRRRQRHFHLELAVKYYLSYRKTTHKQLASHWAEWLGPTNTDHLNRKIHHLTQHQILLSDHAAAKQPLEELGISTLAREIEIKGYLFQSLSDPLPAPRANNNSNILCQWLTVKELKGYIGANGNNCYGILPKTHWLAPARAKALEGNLFGQKHLIQTLCEHFQQHGRPQLVAAFDKSGCESRRFFVTEPAWPLTNVRQPGKSSATL